MRIGIDVKELAKGKAGIAAYIRDMLNYFCEFEDDNLFFLFSNRDFDMAENWTKCKKIIYKSKITGSISVCYELNKLIEENKIELFWGPEHCIPLNNKHIKTVVTIHDIAVIKNPSWGTCYNSVLQRLMVKRSVKIADGVVAISESTLNDLKEYCLELGNKGVVIYNGDSPYVYKEKAYNEKEDYEYRLRLNLRDKYFLFCGTIEPRKNIIGLVKAFEQYKEITTSNSSKLVICGGLGWKYRPIIRRIQRSKVCDDIILTGYVSEEEKEFLYRNAIALVFISFYEGFGLPIVEAMSCGIPVITDRVSAMPEVGGEAAYYVENPGDYLKVAEMMKIVEEMDEHERNQQAIKLLAQSKKFSKRKCAEELLEYFASI